MDSEFLVSLHKVLAARDLLKCSRFFMPHPPIPLGRANIFHLASGMPSVFLMAVHRKEKHIFLILVKLPFGIYANEAQYTGML